MSQKKLHRELFAYNPGSSRTSRNWYRLKRLLRVPCSLLLTRSMASSRSRSSSHRKFSCESGTIKRNARPTRIVKHHRQMKIIFQPARLELYSSFLSLHHRRPGHRWSGPHHFCNFGYNYKQILQRKCRQLNLLKRRWRCRLISRALGSYTIEQLCGQKQVWFKWRSVLARIFAIKGGIRTCYRIQRCPRGSELLRHFRSLRQLQNRLISYPK